MLLHNSTPFFRLEIYPARQHAIEYLLRAFLMIIWDEILIKRDDIFPMTWAAAIDAVNWVTPIAANTPTLKGADVADAAGASINMCGGLPPIAAEEARLHCMARWKIY